MGKELEKPLNSAYFTSVQITREMLETLKAMKKYPRESMREVLERKLKLKRKKKK